MNIKLIEDKKTLEENVNKIYMEKARGHQIRARAEHIADGEKSTSYFLNLEKIKQTHNVIHRLKRNDDTYVETNEEVLDEAATFYENLYSGCFTLNVECIVYWIT